MLGLPHELEQIHLTKHINVGDSLLYRKKRPIFRIIITGDKTYCLRWSSPKRSWTEQNTRPSKANNSPEEDCEFCVVGHRYSLLSGTSREPNYCFECLPWRLLLLNEEINRKSPWSGQSQRRDVPLWQRRTPHLFDNPSNINRAPLGSDATSTL